MVKTNLIVVEGDLIPNGEYELSGVGFTTIPVGFFYDEETADGDTFCLNGITYVAYADPDDGYRSYGIFAKSKEECQYKFPPQKVKVTNYVEKDDSDETYYPTNIKKIVITDAVTGDEILVIGTDYSDDYYPCAIFRYTPENLYINKGK